MIVISCSGHQVHVSKCHLFKLIQICNKKFVKKNLKKLCSRVPLGVKTGKDLYMGWKMEMDEGVLNAEHPTALYFFIYKSE